LAYGWDKIRHQLYVCLDERIHVVMLNEVQDVQVSDTRKDATRTKAGSKKLKEKHKACFVAISKLRGEIYFVT